MKHYLPLYKYELKQSELDETYLTDFFQEAEDDQQRILENTNWITLINLNRYKTDELINLLKNHPNILNSSELSTIPKNSIVDMSNLLLRLGRDKTSAKNIGENKGLFKSISSLYSTDFDIIFSRCMKDEEFFRNVFIESGNWVVLPKNYQLIKQHVIDCPWIAVRLLDMDLFAELINNPEVLQRVLRDFRFTNTEINFAKRQFKALHAACKNHGYLTLFSVIQIVSSDYIKMFIMMIQEENDYYTKDELNNLSTISLDEKTFFLKILKSIPYCNQFIMLKMLGALIEPALISEIQGIIDSISVYFCNFKIQKIITGDNPIGWSINLKLSYINDLKNAMNEQWLAIENFGFNDFFTQKELEFNAAVDGLLILKNLYFEWLLSQYRYNDALDFIAKQQNNEFALPDAFRLIIYPEQISYCIKKESYEAIRTYIATDEEPRRQIARDALTAHLKDLKQENRFKDIDALYKIFPEEAMLISRDQFHIEWFHYLVNLNEHKAYEDAVNIFSTRLIPANRPYELKRLYELWISKHLQDGKVADALSVNGKASDQDKPFTNEQIKLRHVDYLAENRKYENAIDYMLAEINLTDDETSDEISIKLFNLYEMYIYNLIEMLTSSQQNDQLLIKLAEEATKQSRNAAADPFLRGEIYRRNMHDYLAAFQSYKEAIAQAKSSPGKLSETIQDKANLEIANLFITGKIECDLQSSKKELIARFNIYIESKTDDPEKHYWDILNRYIPAYEYVKASDNPEVKRLKMEIMCKLTGKNSLDEKISEMDFVSLLPGDTMAVFVNYYQGTNPEVYERIISYSIILQKQVYNTVTKLTNRFQTFENKNNDQLSGVAQSLKTIMEQTGTIDELRQSIQVLQQVVQQQQQSMQAQQQVMQQQQQAIQQLMAKLEQQDKHLSAQNPSSKQAIGGGLPEQQNVTFFRMP